VQALTTQINLARMSPAQLVAFIEKQAGECMTPSPSEERNWSQKEPAVAVTLARLLHVSKVGQSKEKGKTK